MSKQLALPGFGVALSEKVKAAIELIQQQERLAISHSDDGYYGCFSGGKDSVVIKHLTGIADVRATWNYNCTTIDPPEIYRFIRSEHSDVIWHRPEKSFFKMMAARTYPTRISRWCCQELKEMAGSGKVKIVGVRWAESRGRLRWQPIHWFEAGADSSWMVNPILTWTDDDIWKYIHENEIPYCCLYDEGFKRLGCVGCPVGRASREREFKRWPQYKQAWLRAFKAIWERRKGTVLSRGKRKGQPWPGFPVKDHLELFDWWMSSEGYPEESESCQLGLW